jgi:DNA-binding IclR family transcriptional regulator
MPDAVHHADRNQGREKGAGSVTGARDETGTVGLAETLAPYDTAPAETGGAGETAERPGSGSLAPAVTRAVQILDVLAARPSEALGPSELARLLGLPKSSIANICGALADAGLVRRIGTGFSLGRRLAELGGAYLATVDQVEEFYEVARRLPTGADETVQFAVLDGLEVTYLARHDGRQPVRLTSAVGRRLPAFSTATGKAALASLSDDELGRRFAGLTTLPRATRRAHATVDELMHDLEEVRRRGYAMDDEETMEGVVCYGVMVPSRLPGEGPCAASITLLKVRATAERVPGLIDDLHWLAHELSDPLSSR